MAGFLFGLGCALMVLIIICLWLDLMLGFGWWQPFKPRKPVKLSTPDTDPHDYLQPTHF